MNIYLDVFEKNVDKNKRKLVDEPINIDLIAKNKFANNSEYIPDSVYKRILNKITDYQWSFVPHSWEEKEDFVQFIGLLIVPGFGVHTGVGSAKKTKKDNSNALSAAKTYAFKNACKEMGLAPNVDDKDELYDEELFEHISDDDISEDDDFDLTEEEKPKKKPSSKKKKSPSKKKMTLDERIEEVKQAYELHDDEEFVAFIQIWDEDILELDDMDNDDWEDFLDFLESNKDKFEDF